MTKLKFLRWLCTAVLFLPLFAQAKVVGLFDLDGTVFNDRGDTAAWVTPWLLVRLDQMHSMFQQVSNKPVQIELNTAELVSYYNEKHGKSLDPNQIQRVSIDLPDQLPVSYHDYIRFQENWAKDEIIAGVLRPVLLTYDPLRPKRDRLIVPGYYRRFDLTYKYYRERRGPARDSYIVKDFEQALERAKLLGEPYTWKGPAFELYESMMSNRETVPNVVRFTSRGHRSDEYYELDDLMVAKGYIGFARGPEGERPIVHSFSQPDARIYGEEMAQKKVNVVVETVKTLYRTSAAPHLELHPEPLRANRGETVMVHTVIVAEDEPSYVAGIADAMANLSGGYFADKVKLVLFNSGSDEEIKRARFPWRWTVLYNRQGRPAREEEIAAWLKPAKVDCNRRLAMAKGK